MEKLKDLLVDDFSTTNKSIKQADSFVRMMLEKNIDQFLNELADTFCSYKSVLFPINFLQHTIASIKIKGYENVFTDLCQQRLSNSFWESKSPNICSLVNHLNLFGCNFTFRDVEQLFINKIKDHIHEFPVKVMKVLPNIFEDFTSYMIGCENCNINIEDNGVFKSTNIKGFFASMLVSVSSIDNGMESTKIIRFISSYIVERIEMDHLLPSFFESSIALQISTIMKQHRFLYLCSEVARELNLVNDSDRIIIKVDKMISESNDADVLCNCYNALSICILLCNDIDHYLENISIYLLRDFNTVNDYVRFTLCKLFENVLKRAKEESKSTIIAQYYIDSFSDVPWNSRLKKWIIPLLIEHAGPEKSILVLEELLLVTESHGTKPFISKCISSFSSRKEICQKLFEVTIINSTKISVVSSLPQLRFLFEPLFSQNPTLVEQFLKMILDIKSKFHRIWLLYELSLSYPSLSKDKFFISIIRDSFAFSSSSINWDMRSKYVQVFVELGFPYIEDDCLSFVQSIDNIILCDSAVHQTILSESLNDLAYRLSFHTKKYTSICAVRFLEPILTKASKKLASSYVTSMRHFAFCICSGIWKYFPAIGSEQDILLLISVLNDHSLSFRQPTITLMRNLTKDIQKLEIFKSIGSDEVNKYVLSINEEQMKELIDDDFPKDFSIENIKKFRILLERNETVVPYSPFYLRESIPILMSIFSQPGIKWGVQSEIFASVSLLGMKLKEKIDAIMMEENATIIFDF